MSEERKPKIATDHAEQIRKLIHDMSNGLEIIVQTNYLLNMVEQSPEAKQWLKMMEVGVQQTASISSQLRDYVIANCDSTRLKPPHGT